MTATWQPGTTYVPGSTVVPVAQPVTVNTSPANRDFTDGLAGWNAKPGWFHQFSGGYNGGAYCALAKHAGTNIEMINTNQVPVAPSDVIKATCQIKQGKSDAGDAKANVCVFWFDSDHEQIERDDGNEISSSSGSEWKLSTVTATAPALAAFAAIGVRGSNTANRDSLGVDAFSWDYTTGDGPPLVFTATQTDPGKSADQEPDWPDTVGATVVDNEVTWTGGEMTSVTWTASRIMESGATEPTWPETVGDKVEDGSVTWVCLTPQVQDPNCPQTPYVVIAASKIYAADEDIIRYSATVSPRDWSTRDDAGFLPFGLNTYGSNPIAAMGLYRSNIVAFNSEGFQMWQVDEDPANSQHLDALPVGSTQHEALAPMSNDLFFLSSQGVRTMGISAGADNLQAGDVGMPIDPLVQAAMAHAVANGITPLATYYPAQGQYWLAFPGYPESLFF